MREKTVYDGMSMEELDKEQWAYHRTYWDNGGSMEGDWRLNDISRAKIDTYAKLHENVFMTKINDYDNCRPNPQIVFTPYTGQRIYNFEFDILIPCEDEPLRTLLAEHLTPSEYTSSKSKNLIDKIFQRVESLGGIHLSWV